MNLTKLALRRPVSVCIVLLALLVFGFSTMATSSIELMPDIEMPMLIIATTYPGAGPEEVEELVTSKVEAAIATLSDVDTIQSVSQENMSMVMVQLDYGTNMDVAHMDVKDLLDLYASGLPEDAGEPMVMELNVDMASTVTLSASAEGDVDILYYVQEEIVPQYEKLSGVASVDVYGGRESYIRIELREEMLKQYNLSMNTIATYISAANFSFPAGSVGYGNSDLSLRGGVEYNTVEELKSIPLTLPSGDVIQLSDVANIYTTKGELTSLSQYNGKDNVTISINKRQSASTMDVSRAVAKTTEQINASNLGVSVSTIYDSSDMISSSVDSVIESMVLAVIFSMVVLFLFFGDLKGSLVVGSSMPISLLTTLIVMQLLGFGLNIVTLGGLVIGVGMMVDNSIIVLESCFRAKEQNHERTFHEAALEGTRLVTSSIIASTLTSVVVFLPLAMLQGMSGQMFSQLGYTIVFSLTASLISALTLVPLLFGNFKPGEKTNTPVSRLLKKVEESYGNFLRKTFRHKRWVVISAVGLFVLSIFCMQFVHKELIPAIDQGSITVSVETKPGLNLDGVRALVKDVEEMIASHEDVDRYSFTVGGSSLLSGSGGASFSVYLKDNRKMSTAEVVEQWKQETKNAVDCSINISSDSMTTSMTGGSSVQIYLQSTELNDLREAAKQVKKLMENNGQITGVTSNITDGNPQAEVLVDPVKASAVGLTPAQVVSSVGSVMNGTSAGSIRQNGREYDLKVEYPQGSYETVEDLGSLILSTPTGRQVPLLDIAEIRFSNAPQNIIKMDNQYLATITGQPDAAIARTAQADITRQIQEMGLPGTVDFMRSTADEMMIEEFTAILGAIATAIFLVFMVMAMQFESPRFSLVVMLCVPFSLIGSFLMLLITNSTFSMTSLTGFLMLVGIVVNNGILFIDTANILQKEQGMDPESSLVETGKTRLRPILMTTLTTVLSMIPMAAGIGGSGDLMQGMAVVIIGGLCASTLLTLLLLPSFYLIMRKKDKKDKKPKQRWFFHKKQPADLLPGETQEPVQL